MTQTGVLIRPELLSAKPNDSGHLLVYMRREIPGLLAALHASGRWTRIYGLGRQPSDGRLEFGAVDERLFSRDLAECHAVITTAGNQLLGESLYLRRPVLAIPEPGTIEQAVNAHFLAHGGGGMSFRHDRFSIPKLLDFLDAVPELQRHIDVSQLVGNNAVRAVLARHLPRVARTSVHRTNCSPACCSSGTGSSGSGGRSGSRGSSRCEGCSLS